MMLYRESVAYQTDYFANDFVRKNVVSRADIVPMF